MRQPLSYQTLPYSCWVTSVTNGLLFLYGDKNKIPGFAARLLNSVLTDQGVESGGASQADWEIVLEAIASKCKMEIRSYEKAKADRALRRIDFSNTVAVCDIGAGTHSILVNGREGDWYMAFDPDWDQVKGKNERPDEYEKFPIVGKNLEGRINVKIHKDHLFNKTASKHRVFAMGAVSDRNVTIIKKA